MCTYLCVYVCICTHAQTYLWGLRLILGIFFKKCIYFYSMNILSEYTSVCQVHVVFLEAEWRWIPWNFIWSYRWLWAEPPHGCQELNPRFYERVTSALNHLFSPRNLVQLLSHVVFWGKVSQSNSELTVTESADSQFSQPSETGNLNAGPLACM